MQAVILAAGKGTRMAKDYDGPKQLLPVNGKPLISYTLDQLPDEVSEIVLVVGGPHEDRMREYFSDGYGGREVKFVRQEEQLGLAHAFNCARDVISGKWMGLIADDILGDGDLKKLAEKEVAVLAHRVDTPENFGVLVADEEGNLKHSVEKPQEFISDLVWTGHMVMGEDFFKADVEPSARGEYETPDVWMKLINEMGHKIEIVEADFWIPVNDKSQLEKAEGILKNKN